MHGLDDKINNSFTGLVKKIKIVCWMNIYTGKDKLNCGEANSIGEAIHQTLDEATLAAGSMKRKGHLIPLQSWDYCKD
jgi:hypothetical protein